MNVGRIVYLDTNIFIYAFEDAAGIGAALRPLFESFEAGQREAVTIELTLAEVLVRPAQRQDEERFNRYLELLRSGGPFVMRPMDRAVLIEAARLRGRTGLRLPDAIHAATALASGCDTFLTNDRRLAGIDRLNVMTPADLG